jgi:N-acetylmuramoyl-L-alanine amidase
MRWSRDKVPSTQYPVPSNPLSTEGWVRSIGYWVLLLVAATLLAAAPNADEKHVSVYSPVAIYNLPVLERAGREYVGVLELLEPLGRVSTETNGRYWRLRYNNVDAAFMAGKTRGKIRGRDFDFPAPFLIDNSRGLVPLSSLSAFLPRFLGAPVAFHESSRRLLIGNVGIQINFQLDAGAPPRLAVGFSAPVNPAISTEPGKLRMHFKRDPVVSPGSATIAFDNKIITQANYSETNGDAELEIAANQPLMASFSNDRKTIIVSAIPQAANATSGPASATPPQNPAPAQSPGTPAANAAPGNPNSNPNPAPPQRMLAVVDPAHGGDERGAALAETLAEKDVTLGFARLLRHELENRGFAVALLRDSDTSLIPDQRAAAANVARAGIYISLHAVSQGNGARVYTALLPVAGASNGVFHPWNAAQGPSLPVSRLVSAAIVNEMQKKDVPARSSSASLRPLNNVFMPAVAVELAPGPNGLSDLTSATYQQRVASAIADGVVAVRNRLGVQP